MPPLASLSLRRSLVGVLALVGCVSVQPPGSRRLERAGDRFERIRDSVALASSLAEGDVAAAPRIRLVVPPAMYASTRYVEASFHLSDDAYVLVMAVDLDRRVRVLYPETPDQSGFAARNSPHRLTRFFAGFGDPRGGGFSRYDTRYDLTQRISAFSGGGVLLAVASDRPLQLERLIDPAGDWDEHQLSQLIFDQSLQGAANAVGRALVLTGQEYNTDYRSFNGGRTLGGYSLASSGFDECGYGYAGYDGPRLGYGSYRDGVGTAFVGFHQRNGRTYARYVQGSACGRPVYYDVPVLGQPPVVPPDTVGQDSAVVVPPRVPRVPRLPSVAEDGVASPLARRPSGAGLAGGAEGRMRPPVASGLRFRPPEQVPSPGTRLTSHDVGDPPARRGRPWSSAEQSGRPNVPQSGESLRPVERRPREGRQEPRGEPARLEPPRAEPARGEPARVERPRMEPARQEPRHEPAREAPMRSEPVRREPTPSEPRPITPR